MKPPLIQSAVNISEGRNTRVIDRMVRLARDNPGVVVADWSADADHNRMVLSLLGHPEALFETLKRISETAVELIDLRQHSGLHPRIGVMDVIPFVPISGIDMAACVELSKKLGEFLGIELGVPTFLYEQSAMPGRISDLPTLRKGGFEAMKFRLLEGISAPDFGPNRVHPSAGACVAGARAPLVAYNVNLTNGPNGLANRIAASLRRERIANPSLRGIRALGLSLPTRSCEQVSMNLTDLQSATLHSAYAKVCELASREGHVECQGEIIGLLPVRAMGGAKLGSKAVGAMKSTQILEVWLN